MPHKLASYVHYLLDERFTEAQVEEVLGMALEVLTRNDLLAALLSLPMPESGWDLDRWWGQVVRERREGVKRELIEVYGESCEACEKRPATDLHEIVPRSSDMSWRQIFLFGFDNCCLLCRKCHESGAADTEEFRERIRARRAWQGI